MQTINPERHSSSDFLLYVRSYLVVLATTFCAKTISHQLIVRAVTICGTTNSGHYAVLFSIHPQFGLSYVCRIFCFAYSVLRTPYQESKLNNLCMHDVRAVCEPLLLVLLAA